MFYLSIFFVSLLLALALTPLFIKVAFKKNFLDYPDPKKVHFHPTPLLGGASVFLGFCGGVFLSLLSGHPWTDELSGVLIGGSIILGLGLWDDKKGMQPGVKLLVQIIASFLFLWVSHTLGGLGFGLIGDLLFFLWMVGLMNAFNFLDIMDGLCSGMSFVAAAAFMVIFIFTGQTTQAIFCLALMGALLGFLWYNFPPAKIFLGDAGSMFDGFILSVLGILSVQKTYSSSNLLVPVLILSYPIFDISFVTLIRAREGRKIYIGDYNNSPRRIFKMSLNTIKTVLWIYLICALLGMIGILIYFFFDSPMKILLSFLVGLVLIIFGIHLHRRFVSIKEKIALILGDAFIINLVFLFFFWLRFRSGIFPVGIFVPFSEYFVPSIWITIFWLNLFAILGLYDFSLDSFLREEWKRIFKAIGMGLVIFIILSFNSSYLLPKSWLLFIIYGVSLCLSLGVSRGLIIFLFRKLYLSKKIRRKAIIVGTGENAVSLQKKIDSHSAWGYELLGFVACDDNAQANDLNILGELENLDQILWSNPIQDILIAVDSGWNGSLEDLSEKVGKVEVNFKTIPELKNLIKGYRTEKQKSDLLLIHYSSHLKTWEWGVKRMLDFIISLFSILVLSPLWLLISFFISLNYSGGIINRKRFLGKGGKPFELFSFNSGPLDSQSRLIKFMKSSRIEKLPVLLNVLKGEMSLVGPQPEEESTDGYSSELSDYYKRVELKPGIFSLKKKRKETLVYSENMIKGKIEDNLLYTEKVSLWLDFKIILNQIFKPILRRQDV